MTLHIPIPEGLDDATVHDLDKTAREAVALRLYQQGKLLHKQFAALLGLDRWQAEELLHQHGISDLTVEEIDRQFDTIQRAGN
jgi:hypothetical protein